jgi:hypothetical protein
VHPDLTEDILLLEIQETDFRAITTAKEFVERNFGAMCSCDRQTISPDADGIEDRPMGLREMARF